MAQTAPIKPVGNHVLIKRAVAADISSGGIVLPDSVKERPQEGKVIAIGNGKVLDNGERSSFSVTDGDRIIFPEYAGDEIGHDGEEYVVMKESDIIAVIN